MLKVAKNATDEEVEQALAIIEALRKDSEEVTAAWNVGWYICRYLFGI